MNSTSIPQYREGPSFTEYRQKDEKPHTAGLDDTAIPLAPQTPRFWKTPVDISRFGSFVN